jgi:hypothetical protein
MLSVVTRLLLRAVAGAKAKVTVVATLRLALVVAKLLFAVLQVSRLKATLLR